MILHFLARPKVQVSNFSGGNLRQLRSYAQKDQRKMRGNSRDAHAMKYCNTPEQQCATQGNRKEDTNTKP